MEVPVPFFTTDESGTLHMNSVVIKVLSQSKMPVSVVSTLGKYRSGMSDFLNRLLNEKSGFSLGETIQTKTKDIWIWARPHPLEPNRTLLLLDANGLEVEKVDEILELVKYLVYNSALDDTLIQNRIADFEMSYLSGTTIVDNVLSTLRPESYVMCRELEAILRCLEPEGVKELIDERFENIFLDQYLIIHSICSLNLSSQSQCTDTNESDKHYSVDDKANKIRSNFQMICDQVDTQRLLDQMYQDGILSEEDMNEISNSNRNKTQKLLMTLFRYKKLKSWIPEFLNFIKNNNNHVYRVIMKTDVPLVKESQRLMFSQIFSKNVKCDNTSGKRAMYIREIIRRNSALIIKEMEAKLQNSPYIKTRYKLSDDDCVFIDSQTDDLGKIEAAMICLLGKEDNHWVYDFLRSMRAVIGDKRLVGMFNIPININVN